MVGMTVRVLVLGAGVGVSVFSLGCGSAKEVQVVANEPGDGGSSGDGAGGSPSGGAGDGSGGGGDGGDAAGSSGAAGSGGAAGAAASAGSSGAAGSSGGGSGFPPITDLSEPGAFPTNDGDLEGPNCTVFRPANLGEGGLQHPIIIWANGTGGPTAVYSAAFRHWASHGFVVVAGNSINGQGAGAEALGCLTYTCDTYQGSVDCTAGASGHSQGGGGALMAGQDPRVITTAPLQPYILMGLGGFETASITNQTGPMLLLSGTNDTIAAPAQNQEPVFDDTNVPVVWANLIGGDHLAVALNGLETYRETMLAWFRLHLMGDEDWRYMFYGACTLCSDTEWIVERRGMD
jgi:hypothetical protein